MANPALRILIALMVALVSPMCCCQAALAVGVSCGERAGAEEPSSVEDRHCCDRCTSEKPSDSGDPQPAPGDPGGDCTDCPSCQGTSVGSGLLEALRASEGKPAFDMLASALLCTDLVALPRGAEVRERPGGWPPLLPRSGRAVLRWQCALTI